MPPEEVKIPAVEIVELKTLKIDGENPNRMSDKQKAALWANMQKFGVIVPIITNNEGTIADGQNRWEILIEHGIDKGPVVKLPISDVDRRILRQVLNKLKGQHDLGLDDAEYRLIFKENQFEELQRLLGDSDKQLVQFLASVETGGKDTLDIEKAVKHPKFKVNLGDVWELGKHRLICGDVLDKAVVEKLMGQEKAKMVFTSPPYNINADMYENDKDNKESEDYIKFNLDAVKALEAHVNGFIFWNLSYNKNSRHEFMEIFLKILKETGFDFLELIVWNKKIGLPITSRKMLTRQYEDILLAGTEEAVKTDLELFYTGANDKSAWFNKKTQRGITNYWEIVPQNIQLENLKACFPIELPKKGLILMTEKDEIVLDPFGGSGTTLVACEQLTRQCRMIEIDPIYCSVVIERWEKVSGLQAKNVSQKEATNGAASN